MILYEVCGGSEQHPVYQALEVSNSNRQYDFLESVVGASLQVGRPFLSSSIIKALNYHAIACLHSHAGEFRPCHVEVGTQGPDGYQVDHRPPAPHRVQALMDDFVNTVNRNWEASDPFVLAAYVLWRLNWIHPFINGNGRTARAACYFVLCVKAGSLLAGTPTLPELIRRNRVAYVDALRRVDEGMSTGNPEALKPLNELLGRLVDEQVNGAQQPGNGAPEATDTPQQPPPNGE